MNKDEMSHGEIVIVKRGGGDHDEHHGGVWKIAFADFMTAMMAFFLVMWLINASNEVTKKAVASYFNPIKLMDNNSSPRGVESPKQGLEHVNDDTEQTVDLESDSNIAVSAESIDEKYNDQGLFIDPYAVLSEIAGGVEDVEGGENKNESGEQSSDSRMGISGGTSFQDPFDPTSWSRQLGLPKDPQQPTSPVDRMSEDSEVEVALGDASEDNGMMRETTVSEELQNEIELVEEEALKDEHALDEGQKEKIEDLIQEMREETSDSLAEETAEEEAEREESEEVAAEEVADEENLEEEPREETELSEEEKNEESEKLAEEISTKIAVLSSDENLSGLELEVLAEGDGASVIISDKGQNGMFRIGSARPTRELVLAMEKIGEIVADHPGNVEISGHTDGRQYQSADYDNWRLSSARAHMAYYMLTRGGMKESQVERIVGQAAVDLKTPEDPFASVNRRVEVLLKLPQ